MSLIQERESIDNILVAAREFVVRESLTLIDENTVEEHISLTREIKTVFSHSLNEKIEVLYAKSRDIPLSNFRGLKRDEIVSEKYIINTFKLSRDDAREYLSSRV
ncbi:MULTISPECIES: hypothetical protein [Metabacillus]|uniref:hypothetical protein n=1 Tax=Metabacillus TaxID=2675233 RepID=UPI000C805DDF|nr:MULTISPECIES: hypothetical protein [Metabacillus]MCM3443560.1 hypothetical protein [Metabacillus halosaccharovorans]PMC35025.1 hypothetical protein CJ195_21205 [Bacillus sp. UMB0899]